MGIEVLALALDGVVFDTEEAHLKSCNAAFESCDLDLRWSMQQFREAARVWGANNALACVTEKISAQVSRKDAARLLQEKHRLFHAFALDKLPVQHPGSARLMEDALDSGCKLAVLTDMPVPTATALLDRTFGDAVTNMFAVVVSGASFSDAAGNGPHHLMLRTVGVDAAHCAVIESAPPGLRAAQRAGIWTVAATPYEKDIAHISGADLWYPHLQELRHLIGKKNTPSRAAEFVTFDALKMRKRGQRPGMPASTQPLRERAAA